MSKIKVFALGGLDENGKNMYCVEVDNDIFIFDAGLKYPEDEMLGVDYVLPKYDYLKSNVDRIKGIFLTHGHMDNIGALPELLKEIPSVRVFASKLTIEILKLSFSENEVEKYNLNVIRPHYKIDFGKNSIFPMRMTHSIPDALGYALYTSDGIIYYTGDFIFDQTAIGHYSTDIGKLAYLGKQGVLCLLSESIAAEKSGHTSPKHRVTNFLSDAFYKAKGRIIISVFSSNLYRIQEILDEAKVSNRRVVVIGQRLQQIFNKSLELGYIDFPKELIASYKEITKPDVEDIVIIVSGNRDKPFSALYRIASGNDKLIKVRENDTVIIASPAVPGTERISAKVIDELYKTGAEILVISRKVYYSHHASQEDLLFMINLLQPKYLIPVKGEYRQQVAHANAASKCGFQSENVLLLDNGEVVEFINGEMAPTRGKVDVGDILIDGSNIGDIGDIVLKDRQILSEDGIVVISATLDRATKKILAGPEVLTRGFVYVKENTALIDETVNIARDIIVKNSENTYDFNKIKQDMRSRLTQYLSDETKRRPMIITMIQEV